MGTSGSDTKITPGTTVYPDSFRLQQSPVGTLTYSRVLKRHSRAPVSPPDVLIA